MTKIIRRTVIILMTVVTAGFSLQLFSFSNFILFLFLSLMKKLIFLQINKIKLWVMFYNCYRLFHRPLNIFVLKIKVCTYVTIDI